MRRLDNIPNANLNPPAHLKKRRKTNSNTKAGSIQDKYYVC